ncbi:MAG TPA: MFS transporter [Candidatus Saccharimonadales bacterium]|nr:MFS transporter [Candidatus Saccharimonadales bacterium]
MEQANEQANTQTNQTSEPKISNFRKWAILGVLSLALAIIIIDTTILNVALGTIIREFNTDIQSIQWVITGYSLTLAALTITGGRLGDLYGRKKMFVLGAIIFAVGSFIASISNGVPVMVAGEAIIEGVGAALMMPATASLLVATFRGSERALAFGIWGGVAAASAAIGPILGGWLTTNYSWRWAFRINIFVVLVLVIGSFLIRESQDTEEKPELDLAGVFLSATGLFFLVFGIIEASRYGWIKAKEILTLGNIKLDFGDYSFVPLTIVLGLLVLLIFFIWEYYTEKQGHTPLVSLKIFRNRQFTSGALTIMMLTLGLTGLIFIIPVFLQAVKGLDAFHTGLSLLPLSLTILIVSPPAGFLSTKIRPKYMILVGMVLNTLAYLILRNSLNVDSTVWTLAPGFIVFGLGMGLVMGPASNLTLSAVSVQESGEAAGVNNTLRQLGSTLGAAIIGSVLLTALATNLTTGINSSQKIPEPLKQPLQVAIASQTSSVEFSGGAKIDSRLPSSVAEEIVAIGHQATVDADKRALLFGAFFALLGFITALFIPGVRNVERGESASSGH